MEINEDYLPIERLRQIMEVLDPCMDDFLFILNMRTGFYEISPSAVTRFNIPSDEYFFTSEALSRQVYYKDLPMLISDLEELKACKKVKHDLQYRWLDREGQPVWINCRGRVLSGTDGKPDYLIGCINEIGRKQKADNVSGLIVASSLRDFLAQHCDEQRDGFMIRLDIDNFREINEKMGMEFGDIVLHDTAEAIEATLGEDQRLYHIVADEFVILDLASKTEQDVHKLYRRIREKIDQYVANRGYSVFFTISAGVVALSQAGYTDYSTLMALTEFSLNEAKKRGKNTDYFFDTKDYDEFIRRKTLMHKLRQAVNDDFAGFEAHFQPVEDIREDSLFGAETLLRFRTDSGPVSPAEFIPLLEESGLIIPVGRWVMNEAMAFCRKMREKIPNFKVSVNVSYIQVLKSDLIRDIVELLKKHGLAAGSIQIELTESGFFESDTSYIKFCSDLKELGIPLALDDFGTGYSNFHYLYHIDPQVIKIDRSFTLKALQHEYEYNLLHHMVELTHSINSKLCIEGIETKEELERICTLNPDYIQGFYFGKSYPGPTFLAEYVNT